MFYRLQTTKRVKVPDFFSGGKQVFLSMNAIYSNLLILNGIIDNHQDEHEREHENELRRACKSANIGMGHEALTVALLFYR